uniref:B box-type domain-containing protein n=1 Tax=Onchocerca volvulus TaxID=6282 RepID=A0A8R1TZC6_ONCVO
MEMYANGLTEENGGTAIATAVAPTTTTTATLDLSSQQQNSYIFGVTDDKSESPPLLKEDKNTGGVSSANMGGNDINSTRSPSPLLDVGMIPSVDSSLCPYCGKQYRKPRVLDCLHSMCEDCIIAQLDGRREGELERARIALTMDFELESTCEMRPTPPGVIRCPTCYQESHVGNDVRFVNHLLLDFVRLHEVDGVSAVKGARTCRACKSEQLAMAVCKQCASDLCKNCYQAHRDMKLFDGHTVLTYAELAQNPSELPRDPVMCVLHPQMPYSLLCATCESPICGQCHAEHADIRHHSLVNIDETVANLVRLELKDMANGAEVKSKTVEVACNSVPARQRVLTEQYEVIKAEIEDTFSEYHKALDAMKENLLRKLDKLRDDQETDLNNLNRRVNVTTVKIADAVAFTHRIVEKGSAVEVLVSRKKIRQQLTALTRSMPDMSSTTELTFSKTPYVQFYNKLSNIVGDITTRLVSDVGKTDVMISSLLSDSISLKQLNAMRAYPSDNSPTQTSASGSLCTTPAPIGQSRGPGAIGMERRNKPTTTSTGSSVADFADGWPPSSIPPEPSSPSPTVDFQGKKNSLENSNSSSFYNWPPSSNPQSETRVTGPSALPLPHAPVASLTAGKQLPITTNNFLMPRGVNSWVAQTTALTGAATQLANTAFPITAAAAAAARQRLEPLLDPATIRLISQLDTASLASLQSAFSQTIPTLGRQSQLASPLEAIRPVGVPSILGEHHYMPIGIPPAIRSSAKNNANASDLSLRCSVGGVGSNPGQFGSPHGFCLGHNEEILVTDTNNHRIQIFTKKGEFIMHFGIGGSEDGHLFYPKKVVAFRSRIGEGGYIIVDKGENKARLQLFSKRGEFIRRLQTPYLEYVSALTVNDASHLVVFSSSVMMFILDIDLLEPLVLKWNDCTKAIGEPSDVAVFRDRYYVTDYKNHCVVALNNDGEVLCRFGSFESTPYPIGVDVSTNGDVLVADSHGNHFHIYCCTTDGQRLQEFECSQLKASYFSYVISRCVGLRLTSEGFLISVSKHNHTLLIFSTIFVNPPAPL